MVQNLLTIFFIVAGVGLLLLNLREWYRRKVIIAPDEHGGFLARDRRRGLSPYAGAEPKAIKRPRKRK